MEEEEGPVETSVLLQDLNPVGTPRKSEGTFDIDIQYIQGCINVQGQMKSYIAANNHRSKNMQCM